MVGTRSAFSTLPTCISTLAVIPISNDRSPAPSKEIGTLNVHIVSVPEQSEQAVVRALSRNPHIDFAELDMAVAAEFIPDDPKFSSAWHLPKIQATDAWDFSTAQGITIAILDTGVDGTHPDLAGNMTFGWNAVDGSTETSDVITIKTRDIQKLLKHNKYDFMKMDIEGAETIVLERCKDYLSAISYIFIEYHSKYDEKQDLDRILSILSNAGFRYHVLPEMVSHTPFKSIKVQYGFDMQLNIFAWK